MMNDVSSSSVEITERATFQTIGEVHHFKKCIFNVNTMDAIIIGKGEYTRIIN